MGPPAPLPSPVPDRGQRHLRPVQRRHRHPVRVLPRGHAGEQWEEASLLQLQESHGADEGTGVCERGGGGGRTQPVHCDH